MSKDVLYTVIIQGAQMYSQVYLWHMKMQP